LFVQHFESKYSDLGAASKSDGVRRFVVNKVHGNGPHLHIQLGKDIISKLNQQPTTKEETNGKGIQRKSPSGKTKKQGT
jgi:hypothetical protein